MIQAAGLKKTFGRRRIVALNGVSFSLKPGTVCCLTGPNGSGKSTLLKILAGLLLPSEGTAYIEGRDVRRMSTAMRRRIGYAAGDRPGFYDQLSARQNLLFFAALWGMRAASAARRVDALLEDFGIEPQQPYQTRSTGAKQRLLLARSLLHEPSVLLWDEPMRSLDAQWRQRCFDRLLQWARGPRQMTVMVATHHPQEWEQADRILEFGDSHRIPKLPLSSRSSAADPELVR